MVRRFKLGWMLETSWRKLGVAVCCRRDKRCSVIPDMGTDVHILRNSHIMLKFTHHDFTSGLDFKLLFFPEVRFSILLRYKIRTYYTLQDRRMPIVSHIQCWFLAIQFRRMQEIHPYPAHIQVAKSFLIVGRSDKPISHV